MYEHNEPMIVAQNRVNAAHVAVEAAEHVQMYPEPMEAVVISGGSSVPWLDLMKGNTNEANRRYYLITGHVWRVDTYYDESSGSRLPQHSNSDYGKEFVIAGQCAETWLHQSDYFALHRNGYWYAWGERFDSEDAAVEYLIEIARDEYAFEQKQKAKAA